MCDLYNQFSFSNYVSYLKVNFTKRTETIQMLKIIYEAFTYYILPIPGFQDMIYVCYGFNVYELLYSLLWNNNMIIIMEL